MQLYNYFEKSDISDIEPGQVFLVTDAPKPIIAIMCSVETNQRALLINRIDDQNNHPPQHYFTRNINRDVFLIPSARLYVGRQISCLGKGYDANPHPQTLYLDGETAYLMSQNNYGHDFVDLGTGETISRGGTGLITCTQWSILVDGAAQTPETIFSLDI